MAAKGYCTADDVAELLGLTFTAGQEAHCDNLIERAETDIDEGTGRGWLVGEQADEAHYPIGRLIFLRYAPVASVESITGRSGPGGEEIALVADEDYELRDAEAGLIKLLSSGYERLLISYTPVDTLPGDLKQAVIELVASRMQPSLQPGTYGLDSYSLPDLQVRFARSHVQEAMPPQVAQTIDRYRYRVHA
jgi:hypothetical protein